MAAAPVGRSEEERKQEEREGEEEGGVREREEEGDGGSQREMTDMATLYFRYFPWEPHPSHILNRVKV